MAVWWTALLNMAGSAAANNAANESAQNITDAQLGASEDQLALSQAIYADQRGLQMPSYLQGQDARNVLGELYGLAPQVYTGTNAFDMGSGMYAGGSRVADGSLPTAPSMENSGIPSLSGMVTGHDASLMNAIGNGNLSNEQWWLEGGPSVSMSVGQGLMRKLGLPHFKGKGDGGSAVDQWGTPQDNAGKAQGFDGASYLSANPDLRNAFTNLSDRDQRYIGTSFDFDGNGRVDQNEYGAWHYQTYGKNEGRAVPAATGAAATGTAGATGATGGATPASVDPMQRFYNSPDAKLATNQFLNFDVPELQSAFAVGGKALSGAQQGALAQQGAGRLGNAFADYKSGLGTLAGYGQAAGSQVGSYAQQYGSTAGNAFANMGAANANNAAMRGQNQQNLYNGIGRAFGSQGWT